MKEINKIIENGKEIGFLYATDKKDNFVFKFSPNINKLERSKKTKEIKSMAQLGGLVIKIQ
jgi:hypothetical protein